jgi:hypothetical protein
VTSERQKAANRANARRSTGPKTPEGKAVVRLNALRHGVLARDVVLPEEDFDTFEDLLNRVRAELSPVGPIEELLADRVVNTMWRLLRSARAETALFDWRVRELQVSQALADQVRSHEVIFMDTFIADKAAHKEATEALARAKDERDRDALLLGRAVDADAKESDALGPRQARPLRKEPGTVALSEPRRAPPVTGPTPESSLTPDFGCRYALRRRSRMTADIRIPPSTRCGPALARSISDVIAAKI